MRKLAVFLIINAAALVTIILTVFLYNTFIVLDVQELGMDFKSTYKVMGMNTGTDAIHFGEIPVGNSGKRFANLTNRYPFPIEANIRFKGEAAPFVTVDKNRFYLKSGETTDVTFTATLPKEMPVNRNYTGQVVVVFKRDLI